MVSKLTVLLLILVLVAPALAQDAPQAPMEMTSEQIVEEWGRVKYCQLAYQYPANRTRVYEYDINSCEAAANHFKQLTLPYDEQSRRNLDEASSHRARVIMSGTRDITWVLSTCRESCGKHAASAGAGTGE